MVMSADRSNATLKNTRLKRAVEKLGLHDTYVFDDLVLEKHDSYLLRPADIGDEIFLYCNENSKEAERDAIVSKVIIAGEYSGLRIKMKGLYSMHVKNKDTIEVEFQD